MWHKGGKIRETFQSRGKEELQIEKVIETGGHGLRKRVKKHEKEGIPKLKQ